MKNMHIFLNTMAGLCDSPISLLHFGLCVSGVCHIHIKTPRETVATEQLQFMTD